MTATPTGQDLANAVVDFAQAAAVIPQLQWAIGCTPGVEEGRVGVTDVGFDFEGWHFELNTDPNKASYVVTASYPGGLVRVTVDVE